MDADVVVVVVAVVVVEVAAVVVVLIGVDVIVAGVVVLSVLKVLLLSSFAFTGIDRFGGPNIVVEFSSSLDIVIVSFGENSSLLDSVLDVNSIMLTTVIVAAKVYKKNIAKPIDLVMMSNDL